MNEEMKLLLKENSNGFHSILDAIDIYDGKITALPIQTEDDLKTVNNWISGFYDSSDDLAPYLDDETIGTIQLIFLSDDGHEADLLGTPEEFSERIRKGINDFLTW